MKNEHILDILDEKSFDEFDEAEKVLIKNHTSKCPSCRQSFEAAKLASNLLKINVTQNFEPSPYFIKRVLANLPDKPKSVSSLWAFAKVWKAAGTMVGIMIVTVLVLAALTVFAPKSENVATADNDSADMVILERRSTTKDLNNEQVFQIMYMTESSNKK